jgi:hypothetical protein
VTTGTDIRRSRAGRAGFILGVVAAILSAATNLFLAGDRLTWGAGAILGLLCLLNVPLFIALSLLAERMSRGRDGGGPARK